MGRVVRPMATGTISQRLPCSARALEDEPLGLECGIELRQGVVDEGAAGYRCPGYWRGAAHGRHRRPRRLLDAGERATGTPIVHQGVANAVLEYEHPPAFGVIRFIGAVCRL